MRQFFKRRLPAFLLTLVMAMTLVPAASARTSADIEYEVDAGDTITFKLRDFQDYYVTYKNDTLYRMEFTDFDGVDDNGTMYAYDYYDREYSLTETELFRNWFYADEDEMGKNDYQIYRMNYVAARNTDGETVELDFTLHGDRGGELTGILRISIGGSSSSKKGDISYTVKPGKAVAFDEDDFKELYNEEYSGNFRYVEFDKPDPDYTAAGKVYYDYDYNDEEYFTRNTLKSYAFYHSSYASTGDYGLGDLSFVADDDFDDSIELTFTIYGSASKYVEGTLTITADGKSSSSSKKGDITYTVKAGREVVFDEDDFEDFYTDNCNGSFKYVKFDAPDTDYTYAGSIYYDYDYRDEKSFSRTKLSNYEFYFDDYDDLGDYALNDLSFVADDDFEGSIEIGFTVYGGSGTKTNQSEEGTLVITDGSTGSGSSTTVSTYKGDIRYSTTAGTLVQINANDIARFFNKSYPNETVAYMTLTGVPTVGALYYNYYGASQYGAARTQLTATTAAGKTFAFSPASTAEYAMTELTYVPSGSNYCAAINFAAYSANYHVVTGTILISVTASAVAELYSVTTKGTSVSFPASSVYSAVASATGQALSSIQILQLPSVTSGILYAGYSAVSTTTRYDYSTLSQLFFLPNSSFTGSVSIPYVALNANGTAIAAGTYSIGVVSSVKRFSDVSNTTWCYKYVTELASNGIISGYGDGTFQEKNTITYGAALKLIMLAAGYSEQAPTTKGSTFSGYLTKAKADGLVTGSPNLSGSITRLQIAQIAAKALKLSTSNLSNKKPFTDTSDVYVQALNAAGIVEGYFSNGTSAYKPNNTLTRGQVSAIVWRMQNYNK